MDSNIYKMLYCSRNRLQGSAEDVAAELKKILVSARKNNRASGVTGALLYNAGNFAQILEGPSSSVERLFKRIQRDPRHSEVKLIYSGFSEERDFPEWSMAFTGSESIGAMPQAAAAFESVFTDADGAGEKMLAAVKELAIQENDWLLFDAR